MSAPHLSWTVDDARQSGLALLPSIRTDALLAWRDGTTTLVECKFNESPLTAKRFGDDDRLRSSHLYQVLTYLREASRDSASTNGLLIYAANGKLFDEQMRLQGFPLRIVALDLFAVWPELRAQLVDVFRSGATSRPSTTAAASP